MRHFRDIPINRKLTAIIMATCLSVLVVAAAAFVINDLISLRQAMVKDLSAMAEVIGINSTAALTFQDKKSAEGTLQALSVKSSILFAVIITNDEKIFAQYARDNLYPSKLPFIDPNAALAVLGNCLNQPSIRTKGYCFCQKHVLVIRPIVLDGEVIGKICLAADLEELYTPLKQNAGIAGLIILASSLLAYLLASVLQRLISKPILQLAQTMKVVSQDKDYSIQAPKLSEDELGILIDGFNEMLVQIRNRDDELAEHRNILEEKVAMRTEELANAQAFLTASIKQTTAGIMIAEPPQLKIRLVNEAAADILNQSQESQTQISVDNIRAMTWSNCYPNGSRYKFNEIPLVQATIKGKTIANEEMRIVRQDGTERWILVNASPIRNAEGDIIAGIAVFSDITERQKVEEEKFRLEVQLQQSQKLEAMGTLAGGVAHDFNNLLQAIQGYTQLLLLEKNSDDLEYDHLQEIEKASQRGAELVQRLLSFSRRLESELRPVDLNQEIMQVGKILERTIPRMIEIEFHLAANLKPIKADPVQLEQVILNLGLNARDAMPDGGKLFFKTENMTLDNQFCKNHPEIKPGDYALLSVADTGQGMNKEVLCHIFEPFYSTKEVGKGTGLGLSMVYGIVKSHQGYIVCTSEPNQGSTFKIYLPISESSVELKEITKARNILGGGKETVLLVDDEVNLRNLGKRFLNRFGYKVIEADSGEVALEIFQYQKDQIDIVILDLMMPGIGGKKCLNGILKICPKAKVIIASGYAGDDLEPEIRDRALLKKPYHFKQLLKAIRQVLDKN
jgi:PAS domain S-box-containing protein